MHNSFILQQYVCYTTILNMFRAARCSSSGGQIVSPQPLVSSPSVSSRTVCRWRAARRRGIRRKKLLDDLKDRRGYSHLKEEALDRTMWRYRFGGGIGPVVRLLNNEYMLHYDPQHVSSRTVCRWRADWVRSPPAYCTAAYRGWRYQRLWWYNLSFWGWAACCSKHVEDRSVTYILLKNKVIVH